MNQEQNNLNPNNFNTQGNNGIPNDQSLNNQSFNQQPINSQPQPMNTFENGNTNNQSFNSKPPKKMNLGLIIGSVAVVAVVGVVATILLTKNNSVSSSNKDNLNNQQSYGEISSKTKNDSKYNLSSPYEIDTPIEDSNIKPFNIDSDSLEKYIDSDSVLSNLKKISDTSGSVKSTNVRQSDNHDKISEMSFNYSGGTIGNGYAFTLTYYAYNGGNINDIYLAFTDEKDYQNAEFQVYKLLLSILNNNEELAKAIVYSTNLSEITFTDLSNKGYYQFTNSSEEESGMCRIYLKYYLYDIYSNDNLAIISDMEVDFKPLELDNLFSNSKLTNLTPNINNENKVQWNANFMNELGDAKVSSYIDGLFYIIDKDGKYVGYQTKPDFAGTLRLGSIITNLKKYPNFEKVKIEVEHETMIVSDSGVSVAVYIYNNQKDTDSAITLGNNIVKYFDNNITFTNNDLLNTEFNKFQGQLRGKSTSNAYVYLETNTVYTLVRAVWYF